MYIVAGIIVAIVVFLSVGYVKSPPNTATIISGPGKHPRVLIGKAGFKIPFLERVDRMGIGQIDIDIFDCGGAYYISEVNPRFGGGYPHAYECGVNHLDYIVKNLEGQANSPKIGAYEEGLVMMKYNEIMIRRENENHRL